MRNTYNPKCDLFSDFSKLDKKVLLVSFGHSLKELEIRKIHLMLHHETTRAMPKTCTIISSIWVVWFGLLIMFVAFLLTLGSSPGNRIDSFNVFSRVGGDVLFTELIKS